MKYFVFITVTVILLIALSCAKQTTPTGGPKDTIPPILLNTIPLNKSKNFTGNSIQLQFNESVQIENAREEVIITPIISPEDFELSAQKKTATLKLKVPLKDSTTYTFNFRESIKDITERNPVKDLKIAISTGSYIDSLSIKGNVFLQAKGTPIEDATIGLVEASDTFNIFLHKPTYFSRSNKEGEFLFENLKPNKYLLYAYDDKNKNLIVDSKSELFGFKSEPIKLTADSIPEVSIPLINLDSRSLKILSSRPYNTYFNIRFTKAFKKFEIQNLDSSNQIVFAKTEDNNNLKIFFKKIEQDSIPLKLIAIDSSQNRIDTLLYVKPNNTKATPEKFSATIIKSKLTAVPNLLTSSVRFNKPVESINYDSMYYMLDSTNIFLFDKSLTQYDSSENKYTFKKEIPVEFLLPEEKTNEKEERLKRINRLIYSKAAFVSIENDSSELIQETIQPLNELNSGIIFVKVNVKEGVHTIVELVDTQFKLIDRQLNSENITFSNVPPGEYQIKLIIDLNNNGEWDPGNFFSKKEPEPILFYKGENDKQTVSVKANWEVGPLLITYP